MLFFKPSLPIPEEEREWIDSSLLRLIKIFGHDPFVRRRTILPKPEFFPDRYTPSEEGLQALLNRVCGYMDVDSERVEFHVYSERDDSIQSHFSSWENSHSGAAGKYYHPDEPGQKLQIGLNMELLGEPMKLVATIAHELGHVILLGGGLLNTEDEDH
jgi:hypothetical protein